MDMAGAAHGGGERLSVDLTAGELLILVEQLEVVGAARSLRFPAWPLLGSLKHGLIVLAATASRGAVTPFCTVVCRSRGPGCYL